jgi:hypothetical protein
MVAKITALKGQLKLDPKLSAIAKEGKKKGNKGDKGEKGKKWKNKKTTSNKKDQKRDEAWKRVPPKENEKKEKKLESSLTIGGAPHGMDSPQACRLQVGKEAQGQPEK